MADPRDLYQALILEHSKHPLHTKLPQVPDVEHTAHNPLCGDRVTLAACIDIERITAIGCIVRGCALCVAAASMMSEAVHSGTLAQARALFQQFDALVHAQVSATSTHARLPAPLSAFAGVAAFPSRRKCATLPWETLFSALDSRTTTDETSLIHDSERR